MVEGCVGCVLEGLYYCDVDFVKVVVFVCQVARHAPWVEYHSAVIMVDGPYLGHRLLEIPLNPDIAPGHSYAVIPDGKHPRHTLLKLNNSQLPISTSHNPIILTIIIVEFKCAIGIYFSSFVKYRGWY